MPRFAFCLRSRASSAVFAGTLCSLGAAVLIAACSSSDQPSASSAATSGQNPGDAGPLPTLDAGVQHATITATAVDTRFVTREHFLAGGEMQISGEPLAEAMQRDLGNYSRDHVPPDIYNDTSPQSFGPWIDLPGFSSGVESYEYSKQAMNNVAFESGAGTSLLYGPLVNPMGAAGPAATALAAALVQHFAQGSNALNRFVFPAGTWPVNNSGGGDPNPTGSGTPAQNPLGWPGIWPTTHLFKSFDPTIAPTGDIKLECAISSDDDPGATGSLGCADYECDATTLHLTNRTTQIDPTVTPGADGFSAWKYGLWVINYLQVMHDSTEAAVAGLDKASELSKVGSPGNMIVGNDGAGMDLAPGTFLGSSDIEGFQAQMFISEIDNRAEDWLMHLTTTDGMTLGGFATLKDALGYDYKKPLQWFPAEIKVTETDDGSGFPKPAYALGSAKSELLDLIGLALGYSEFYALTDTKNKDVGGSQPAIAIFDGDPFPADDQVANGDATLHDRALGMLRVSLVNMDRLHTDPTSGVLVDEVTMNGNVPTRGTTASTTSVAYAILAMRTALRSMGSELELYSNNTPDTAVGSTPLDSLPINYPSDAKMTFSQRTSALIKAEGELLLAHLTDTTGRAWSGWDVAKSAHVDEQDLLDSHTAAVRGLFAAYLATGDTRYHDRAILVFNRLESTFYDGGARMYMPAPIATPVDTVEYTPLRFALLQSTLRDMYELVATKPGGSALEQLLEQRVGRLNKLVLNGWDDRDESRIVDWPGECVRVVSGLPTGGLQMAERTLTGETGSLEEHLDGGQMRTKTSDREKDCVPEIDDAHLPSSLASSITFQIKRD